jgi:hypothetical protein
LQQQATIRTRGDKQAADARRTEEQAWEVRALNELIAQGAEHLTSKGNEMKYINTQTLILTAVLTLVMHCAHSQINCASAANIGSGDQEWGSTLAPNELANACGTAGLGFYSLANDTGSLNSAFGTNAMFSNTSGASNSSFGANSAYSNTTGANNTAFGASALFSNTTGKGNAAQGVNALYGNTTGIRNLGIGSNALYANTTGSYNVALGFDAGYDQTTGNDNIYINNVGVGGESQTLRLGAQGTAGVVGSGILTAYIAGVAGSQVTGSAVYVTSSGQLGVLASAERFKTDVETMEGASNKLAQLRPVTFKLKTDPKGTVQYGLIAEEVAKVYPELVVHGADGRIDGVRYEELAPMLLSEVQRQAVQIRALKGQVEELNDLKQEMRAALRRLQSTNELVAQR